jgi:hypothetical protein
LRKDLAPRGLAIAGFLLLGMTLVGLFLDRGVATVGILAFLAALMLVLSVFAPRMSGRQELSVGPRGANFKITLAAIKYMEQAVVASEQDVKVGKIRRLDEVVGVSKVGDDS